LQTAGELGFHRLFTYPQPVRDLGVDQAVHQAQPADLAPPGWKHSERSFHGCLHISGLEVCLDVRARLGFHLAAPPAPRHGGMRELVARRIADGAIEIGADGADGEPMLPPAPDTKEDVLHDLFGVFLGLRVAESKGIETLPVRPVQRFEGRGVAGADAVDPQPLGRVDADVVGEGGRRANPRHGVQLRARSSSADSGLRLLGEQGATPRRGVVPRLCGKARAPRFPMHRLRSPPASVAPPPPPMARAPRWAGLVIFPRLTCTRSYSSYSLP